MRRMRCTKLFTVAAICVTLGGLTGCSSHENPEITNQIMGDAIQAGMECQRWNQTGGYMGNETEVRECSDSGSYLLRFYDERSMEEAMTGLRDSGVPSNHPDLKGVSTDAHVILGPNFVLVSPDVEEIAPAFEEKFGAHLYYLGDAWTPYEFEWEYEPPGDD